MKRRTSPLPAGSRFSKEAQVGVALALRCGEAMRRCLQKKVHWKDDSSIDPVTATDRDNEQLVGEGLKAAFPTHVVMGEEASAALGSIPELTDVPTWIVDPIDGTTNFVYGIKLSCVSLGFCVGRRPVVGVVYDPYADELFVAAEGEGHGWAFKVLQAEVASLRERLDIVVSKVSVLGRTQELCQQLEGEAHLQLARLHSEGRPTAETSPASAHGVDSPLLALLHVAMGLLLEVHSGWSKDVHRLASPTSPLSPNHQYYPLSPHSHHGRSPAQPELFQPLVPEVASVPIHSVFPQLSDSGRSVREAEAQLSNTLEVGGRALGQGTWATAYRQATGQRKQALRLLCELGIVTQRELSDDLTQVCAEHVEDCVQIAEEILRHWPPAEGQPPQEAARMYFQDRLKAMYMQKAPYMPS
ncbi:IMP1 [Symbiodinium natans]|uniref:IMP1 protein n=1 Tax=Symbiodinium natans TaxID=878477 RepID=A0A812SJZ7_9DINO|nr:IMP1 [Symbiodinium natans]